MSQQNYRTPAPFLDATLRRLGAESFIWDMACTAHDCVSTTGGYVHPDVDSLNEDWTVHARVAPQAWRWLNPPFAQSKRFAEKCAHSGARIAALVPVALGTRWWKSFVHERAVVLGVGRLAFDLPDGTHMSTVINRDCALLAYGVCPAALNVTQWYPIEDWRKW